MEVSDVKSSQENEPGNLSRRVWIEKLGWLCIWSPKGTSLAIRVSLKIFIINSRKWHQGAHAFFICPGVWAYIVFNGDSCTYWVIHFSTLKTLDYGSIFTNGFPAIKTFNFILSLYWRSTRFTDPIVTIVFQTQKLFFIYIATANVKKNLTKITLNNS